MSEHETIENLAEIYRNLLKEPEKPKLLDPEVTKKINDEIESRLGNEGFAKEEELKDWQKKIMGLT